MIDFSNQVLYAYDGKKPYEVYIGNLLHRGGEGAIYEANDSSWVAKIYHPGKNTQDRLNKIRIMLQNPPDNPTKSLGHPSFTWPVAILYGSQKSFVGYLMPRIRNMHTIFRLINPGEREKKPEFRNFTFKEKVRVASNLCGVFHSLHQKGYVIADVNESNVLVNAQGLITIIDTDSFQVVDPTSGYVYPCPVGKPEYTPPEILRELIVNRRRFEDIDQEPFHDNFGLAVLIFQLLMEGWHPFTGTPPSSYPHNISVEDKIMQRIFPYDERVQAAKGWRPPRYAPPYEVVGPELKELFYRTFVESAHEPTLRPSAYDFRMALERLENHLQACAHNPHHFYPRSLSTCPWCERERALQAPTTPLPAQVPITASPQPQPVQRPFSSQPAISSLPSSSLPSTSMTPSPRPSAPSLSTRRLTYFILLFLIGIAATYFMFFRRSSDAPNLSYEWAAPPSSSPALSGERQTKSFRNWKVYRRSNSPLPYEGLSSIVVGEEGEVWLGTFGGGLVRVKGDEWQIYDKSNSFLPENRIYALHRDKAGFLWIGTFGGGLARFDGENWKVYQTSNSDLPSDKVLALTSDGQGGLWVGTAAGLAYLKDESWTVYTPENSPLPHKEVKALIVDAGGTVWIGTAKGLARLSGESWTIYDATNSPLRSADIQALHIDPSGVLWIGTWGGGLARWEEESWKIYTTSNSGLPHNHIVTLQSQGPHTLWIGTKEAGLVRFDGRSWRHYNRQNSGLPDDHAYALALQNNRLWVGTWKGVAVLDMTTQQE